MKEKRKKQILLQGLGTQLSDRQSLGQNVKPQSSLFITPSHRHTETASFAKAKKQLPRAFQMHTFGIHSSGNCALVQPNCFPSRCQLCSSFPVAILYYITPRVISIQFIRKTATSPGPHDSGNPRLKAATSTEINIQQTPSLLKRQPVANSCFVSSLVVSLCPEYGKCLRQKTQKQLPFLVNFFPEEAVRVLPKSV